MRPRRDSCTSPSIDIMHLRHSKTWSTSYQRCVRHCREALEPWPPGKPMGRGTVKVVPGPQSIGLWSRTNLCPATSHATSVAVVVDQPLRTEEADRLANACRSLEEKLIVWSLLDTGLRVSELCSLTLDNIQWQQRALRVSGKGGPHGTRSKQRIVPLSARVRALLEPYFALNDRWFVGTRQAQKIVKRVANRARSPGMSSPTCSAIPGRPWRCRRGCPWRRSRRSSATTV